MARALHFQALGFGVGHAGLKGANAVFRLRTRRSGVRISQGAPFFNHLGQPAKGAL